MIKPRIIFLGTGPVSLGSLEGIHDHFDIEAVITKPDRLIHGKPHNHPVKAWALIHEIPIHQVSNKDDLSRLFKDQSFTSQVGLVVDFGIIIAEEAINYFPLGIINSHFSLLPQLRGADPISFAVLQGLQETGVSLMIINSAMDEGDLIAQEKLTVQPSITTPDLTLKLVALSNDMLTRTLPRYIAGQITPWPQDTTQTPATYSRKLSKQDSSVDWNKPAVQVEREVRAYIGWPGSKTTLSGKSVTITKARIYAVDTLSDADARVLQNKLIVDCGKETKLEILKLKPDGKKEMTAADFLRGLKVS